MSQRSGDTVPRTEVQSRSRTDAASRKSEGGQRAVKTAGEFAASVKDREPEEALDLIAQRAMELASANRASIATLEPDGKSFLVRPIDTADSAGSVETRVPTERSVFGDVVRAASALTTNDGQPLLFVPLFTGSAGQRVIELSRPAGAAGFSAEEIRMVELFTNAAAGYMMRARDRVVADRRLAAIVEVTQAILQGGDRQQVLQMVVRRAREMVGAAVSGVFVPHSDGETLRCEAADGTIAADLMRMLVPINGSLTGRTFTTGEAFNASALEATPGANNTLARMTNYGPTLFVPLAVGDRIAGVMTMGNVGGSRPFSDEDLAVVHTFAAQAAMCLGYAGVREGLQQLEATGAVEGRSLDDTFAALARGIVDTTHSVAAGIFRLEADGRVSLIGSFGLPQSIKEIVDVAAGMGITRSPVEAIRTRGVSIRKAQESVSAFRERMAAEPASELSEFVQGSSWETIVSVPLIYQGRALGALSALYQKGYRVDETEVAFLKIIASQAATTVENARLFTLVQQKAALEERQRLARELHDSVSQALYGIALGAQTGLDLLSKDPAAVGEPLRYMQRLAEAGLAEMRALIFELRPESLEREGLIAALHRLVTLVQARYEITTVAEFGDEPDLSLDAKEALLRIAREALMNTAKHSRATQVVVRLHSRQANVQLEIDDDGIGFESGREFPGHLGMQSMRERALALGGKLSLSSAPGQGTRIRVTVPQRIEVAHAQAGPARPVYRESFVRQIAGFYAELASRGYAVQTRVLRSERMVAPAELAEQLKIRPGDPVVHLLRLRIIDDRPNHIAETFLRGDLFPLLESVDLSKGSLYTLLRERYGARLVRSQVVVEAHAATLEQAMQLEVEAGAPVLVVKNVVHDASGRPLLLARSWHRAGESQVEFEVLASDG